jgi:hypothetical protein
MNFVIWAPPFDLAFGGSIALHRLGHNLATLGHRVWLWASSKNPEWLGQLTEDFSDVPDAIVVYPEVVCGNPLLSFDRVVRWILNTPGVIGGDGVFGDRDLILLWSREYRVDPKYKVSGELTAWRDWSHFRDLGLPRRGACYAVRKGTDRHAHPADALCIDDYGLRGGDDYLIEVFNSREAFYCYDDHTALVELARLCGCRVVPAFPSAPSDAERMALADQQTREFVDLCYQQWPDLRLSCPA